MTPRVGCCVVYLVDEPLDYLFYRHLEQLQRCSAATPLRIYAGVRRLQPKYVDHLRALDFVTLCDLPDTDLRLSFEHAFYLDRLVEIAIADGVSHVATLDVDSFPIADDWLEDALNHIERQGAALAGVLRRENGDSVAPHPCFMLFPAAFHARYRPSFSPQTDDPAAIAFREQTGQRLDTGAGYAITLHREKLRWARWQRSNLRNDHPLLAGIYHRRIFHFGGGSRDKVFSVDVREARKTRPDATLAQLWPEIAARNHALALCILDRMQNDFDGYMRYLLGG